MNEARKTAAIKPAGLAEVDGTHQHAAGRLGAPASHYGAQTQMAARRLRRRATSQRTHDHMANIDAGKHLTTVAVRNELSRIQSSHTSIHTATGTNRCPPRRMSVH